MNPGLSGTQDPFHIAMSAILDPGWEAIQAPHELYIRNSALRDVVLNVYQIT